MTRKITLWIAAAAVLVMAGAAPAHAAKVRVVATLTDLADFARNIGGDLVDVKAWQRAWKTRTASR